ncbi:MAG: zinc dependent phospholipase C family protein [Candidatus Binatia bacterium]
MLWLILFGAPLMVVLSADHAFAWGPVTHLYHGASVLSDLTNLTAPLQRLLDEYRWAYLYGCIAADIVQVKRYTRSVYTHCHSWRVGWKMLSSARSAPERAFAYGYLSHLASDTYSHNYYIPIQLVASFPSPTHRHVYWEARFDAQLEDSHRDLLRGVSSRSFPECDALVERVVGKTLFSFRTNKRIFESMVTLQRLQRWQSALRRFTDRSRFSLSAKEVEHYNRLAIAAIRDLLTNGEQAAVLKHDPNGHENLRRAAEIRRKLRLLRRRRVPIEGLRKRFLDAFAEAARAGQPVA